MLRFTNDFESSRKARAAVMAEWISEVGAIEIGRGFEMAHAEHAVLDGADAIDAPLIVGDGLGELALDRSLRVEAVHELFGECVVSVHVFRGEHDDARSEAVA